VKAIIVAAGRGARLGDHSERLPKTLLPYGQGTILSRILANFALVDITDFVIVVGYRSHLIEDYLREHDSFGYSVQLVENREWEKGNGISVYCAREAVGGEEPVFLSMSDHLVDAEALRVLRDARSTSTLLLTDTRLDGVFDPEDATKVQLEGDRILDIGKRLATYNAVDCGVFRLTTRFFDALQEQIADGRESISDGARLLIEEGDFRSAPIPATSLWIDIDTPESYRHALSQTDRFEPRSPSAAVDNLSNPASRG